MVRSSTNFLVSGSRTFFHFNFVTRQGGDTPEGESYASLMQEYEKLAVDLQFAESANTASRVAYEGALQNAQRQSRYLAAHIQPTAAQKSLTPDRPWLLALGFGLTFVLWSIAMLVYYSIRDRR